MGNANRDGQHRYLVHFDDGSAGMRDRDEPLEAGDVFVDGVQTVRVTTVRQPETFNGLGHAWVAIDG